MWKKVKWALALAGVPVVLAYLGCLDDTSVPELSGPSEMSISLEMKAIPDQLTADGWSSSVIEVVYRDENGTRTPGRTINFDLGARENVPGTSIGGTFHDLGSLSSLNGSRPVAGGAEAQAVSAVTDSDGVARVRYWAPFRTDNENDNVVTIAARPAGSDFRAAVYRQVDIKLRAANRPTFPGTAECSIILEPQDNYYAVGELIFFTAGPTEDVARYEWDFGDGSSHRYGRNVEHAYSSADSYTVTLFITMTSGLQTSCPEPLRVTNDGGPP
jgi:hypothetical protein